jgi:hypothetical protein
MRIALAMALVVLTTADLRADDLRRGHGGDARTELFVEVPLEYDTRVVFPFGGAHHAVPGVVAINKAPYFCRPHNRAFRDRAAFIEHLGVKHGLSNREIPDRVLVKGNQVRYVGD